MFCQNCGQQNSEGAGFCSKCGNQSGPFAPPAPSPFPTYSAPVKAGNTLSTIGIILGIISFLFLPIIFGPAGLICGFVAKSKGEEKAVTAIIVSAAGLVIGMILGALIFASM